VDDDTAGVDCVAPNCNDRLQRGGSNLPRISVRDYPSDLYIIRIDVANMDRARAVITGLAGLLLVLAFLLVRPVIEFFLLAVLLAYPLRPLQKRFEGTFGPRLTAAGLVIGATVVIILPILWLIRVVVREGRALVQRIRDGDLTFDDVERWIEEATGEEVDLMEAAQTGLQESGIGTVDGALGILGTVTNLLIGVALTMFLLYYFLKDGDRFHLWFQATVPLPDHILAELRQELDDVVWAVLASHVLIAVIQGIVAGLGLIVLGVPNAIFWTIVMIFLAVLPIIGSFLVWGPACIYLVTIDQPAAAVALFVYGSIVVSFCDDFLRPIIVDRYTEKRLNPGAIVLGILGGVYLIGFIGIFFGPVIIGSLRSVLDVYRREYVDDTSLEEQLAEEEEVVEDTWIQQEAQQLVQQVFDTSEEE
jgi:predicted PurR-regulated permease PerM